MATKKNNYLKQRREFLQKASLLLMSSGLSSSLSLELSQKAGLKLFPTAHAEDFQPVKRMIFIGCRSGVSLLGFGSDQALSQLKSPQFPNSPFAGNQYQMAGNGLYFNPNSSSLKPYGDNLAITQGVLTEGGHTNLFNFWEGGAGQQMTSPIIELGNKNISSSVINGIHFDQGSGNLVTHQTNGAQNLIRRNKDTFQSTFKSPTLALDKKDVAEILELSQKLSRRQLFRINHLVRNSSNIVSSQNKAAKLLLTDFSSQLGTDDLPNAFSGRSGNYNTLALNLWHTIKAMRLNLINSSCIELGTGDWHGLNTSTATSPFYKNVSELLAATIEQLKTSTDTGAAEGQTLWDTTVIVLGTEFTRTDRAFGADNGDGGSQGIMLIGKNINGGYYGKVNIDAGANTITYSGVNRSSGQALSGTGNASKNRTQELYHTINAAVGNSYDNGLIINKMVKV